MRPFRTVTSAVAFAVAFAVAVTAALGVFGSLASLAGLAVAEGAPATWTAFLHTGACDAVGEVVAELDDVSLPSGVMQGAASALPVARGRAEVPVPLDAILAADHAVVVTRGVDPAADELVACGAVGGVPEEDGSLVIGLAELNDTGLGGVSRLAPAGDGTAIEIRLTGRDLAPQATPQPGAAVVPVSISAFAYVPAAVTVPVGGSVSWTNADPVPHTATARDRSILQTGRIDTGETVTVTFTQPGQYDYFCEYHSGMRGTVVVE